MRFTCPLINHKLSDIFACNALWWNKGVREGTILKSEIGYRDIFSSVLHINDSSDLPDPVTGSRSMIALLKTRPEGSFERPGTVRLGPFRNK